MFRGVVHHTTMEMSSAAELICGILTENRFSVTQTSTSRGLRIEGLTERSRKEVVFRAEPQRVIWSIEPKPSGSTLVVTTRYSAWYASLALLTTALSLQMWRAATRGLLDQAVGVHPMIAFGRLLQFIPAFVLLLLTARMLLVSSPLRLTQILRDLETQQLHGTHRIERSSNAALFPSSLYGVLYTAAVALIAFRAFQGAHVPFSDLPSRAVLFLALPLLGALAFILILSQASPAASARSVLMLPGVGALVGYVFLLGNALQFYLAGRASLERWTQLAQQSTVLLGMMMGLCMVVFTVMGASLFANAVRTAGKVLDEVAHLEAMKDTRLSREVMQGTGFLRFLRPAWIAVWFTLFAAVLLVWLIVARELLFPSSSADHVGAVRATRLTFAAIFGESTGNPRVTLATGIVWVALVLLIIVPVTALVGEMLWTVARTRRHSLSAGESGSERQSVVRAILNDLCQGEGIQMPRVIVVPGVAAASLVTGFGKRGRVIAVGDLCIDLLDAEELRALIAHECAHHLLGDSLKHTLLQLLGRVTLVGDAFVVGLASSFQYEEQADRAAVTRLGVDPRSLASCLRKVALLTAMDRAVLRSGLPLQSSPQKALEGRPARSRGLRRRGSQFWRCMVGGSTLGYWHPSLAERIASLEAMESEPAESRSAGPRGHVRPVPPVEHDPTESANPTE